MKSQRSSTPESTGSDTISLSLVLQSSQGSGPRSSSILRLMIILTFWSTLSHHNLTSPRIGPKKLGHSKVDNHSHILVHSLTSQSHRPQGPRDREVHVTISLRSKLEKLKHSQVKSHNHSLGSFANPSNPVKYQIDIFVSLCQVYLLAKKFLGQKQLLSMLKIDR